MQLPDLFTSAKFVLFSATVSGVVCSSLPAIAQTTDPVPASPSGPVATLDSGTVPTEIMFNPPGGNAPQETRGGASRSNNLCLVGTQSETAPMANQLTGLVPASNYGLTLAERPVFFAYVPPTTAESMMFTLRDEQGQTIYQTAIAPATDGSTDGSIVSVTLPETVAPLALNTNYQWGFAVLCDGQLRPDSPFVTGWVQRVAPDAEIADMVDQSPIEQAAQYSEAGIWYDALTTLAELRQQNPTDAQLTELWAGFLSSVNLDELATMPLGEARLLTE